MDGPFLLTDRLNFTPQLNPSIYLPYSRHDYVPIVRIW